LEVKGQKPELIAGVSNYATFAQINLSFFDAVYLGQPYCLKVKGNFIVALESLALAVKELQQHNKKAYLVTPALVFAKDLARVQKAVAKAVSLGIDAVEVQDLGLFHWLRRTYPQVKVHLGQMANVYNQPTAKRFQELGAVRLMPAPELTFLEQKEVRQVLGLEYEFPIHGRLSLGMAFSCLLARKLPSEEKVPCEQNCYQEYYLDFGDWRMRCVGTSLVTGEEWCLIEHLDKVLTLKPSGLRLETYFDAPEKINTLGQIYSKALKSLLSEGKVKQELVNELKSLTGPLCNGWFFGLSGRAYQGVAKEVKVTNVTS
jgi:putative protease